MQFMAALFRPLQAFIKENKMKIVANSYEIRKRGENGYFLTKRRRVEVAANQPMKLSLLIFPTHVSFQLSSQLPETTCYLLSVFFFSLSGYEIETQLFYRNRFGISV